ncbi:hypothetical protein [Nocardia blacklockiae]|uniref:hypothetical protein n=1 Tax=Nocardia blacklockiae TaxID=480036 RepID=UPI0018930CBB|nr:hypothetical protein [Nocardia blacklockiae]MBF6170213.1 hypothetical protein [Nocardia blacklockiae]
MDDVLLPDRPTRSAVDTTLPPRGVFDPVPVPSGDAVAFADSSDRLVRHLFDVGLQLHTLRAAFERPGETTAEHRAAGDAMGTLLDDLDMLIRDAGLAMLAMSMDRTAGEPAPARRRRTRGAHGHR